MKVSAGRLTAISTTLLVVFALSFVLEPRKTTYSCKTLSSCLGISNRHRYSHRFPSGPIIKDERGLERGSIRYDRRHVDANPEIIFMVLVKDATSWSKDFRSPGRNVHDFLDLLVSTKLDLARASLALLTSSQAEFEQLKAAVDGFPLGRIVLIYMPLVDGDAFQYNQRHDPRIQLERRSAIARLRNYLMIRSLEDEQHIVWIDADVVEFSPNLVQTMISHATSNEDAGIMTTRCYQHNMDNYDQNAWRVNSPQLMGIVQDSEREAAVQKLVEERIMVPALLRETSDEDLIPLSSVGGTILYLKSEIVRQGVLFSTYNVVGTEWDQFGWVGVETEGICYVAKSVQGGGCYVLGGSHYVRHTDVG